MDPFTDLSSLGVPTIPPPGTQMPPGQPRIPPYTPEEEERILGKIGGGTLRGLGWLGGSLGKAFGGRAIRGLLGGHMDELASIIPFSDTLGITDPTREVRGSDLLGGNKDTSFLSPEGIGGLGLDLLLDPASYLTFGGSAVNQLGQAAKKIGVLPKGAAGRLGGLAAGTPELSALESATGSAAGSLAGKALGGHVGVGLPFASPSATYDLSGPLGAIGGVAKAGASYLPAPIQRAGSAIGNAADSTVRNLRSLFDPTVHGATSAEGQLAGRAFDQSFQQGAVGAREMQLSAARALEGGGSLTAGGVSALRDMMEHGNNLVAPPGVRDAADLLQPAFARQLAERQALGLPGATALDDPFVNFFPRHMGPLDKQTAGFGGGRSRALPTGDARLGAREDILKNFPEGTAGVNRLTSDDALKQMLGNNTAPVGGTAPNLLGPAAHIRENFLGSQAGEDALRINLAQKAQAGTATAAELADLAAMQARYKQSLRLADYVKGLDPQYAATGTGIFNQNPLTDVLQSGLAHARVKAGTETAYDLLAKHAQPMGQAPAGARRLLDVLADAGLGEAGQATAGARQQMLKRLPGLSNPADLLDMYVPESIAKDATKFVKAVSTPEGLEPFLKVWDSLTNLTKAGQTSVWPAFHARNAITGAWQNYVTNAFDPRYGALNPMRYVQPIKDAWALRNGAGVIEDAAKIPAFKALGLTDEQATQRLAELAHNHGVIGRGNIFNETIGGASPLEPFRMPGEAAVGLGEKLAGSTWNPLDIAGVGGTAGVGQANKTMFKPAVVGQHAGEAVDETNRMSAFIAKLRQGYDPAQAAAETRLAHFDYSALTPFERSTMRRMIPFYGWLSNNIPFSIRQLAENPGGKLAIGIKAGGEARGQQGGFLPDALQSTLAVPLGGRDETGTQRFLSRTGLPFEDLADYFHGSDYLGSLNPLLKLPLELGTGRQLNTGRKLDDLYSVTGVPTVDELLAQSPASRAVSALRTGVDERKDLLTKAVNMLSGVHLSDVDMEKSKNIAVRDFLQEAVSGNPHFRSSTDFSARPDAMADLNPYEIALLRLQATRARDARERVRIGVPASR